MSRRLVLLMALAAIGLAAASAVVLSRASYTTSSETNVSAATDRVSDWLRLYSQGTDPQGQTGYARRRGIDGVPGPPAASGLDDAISVDLGDFPDKNATFAFARVFSIRTPDAFPDAGVSTIRVTISVLPDPISGADALQSQSLTPFGQTSGAVQTVTLGPGVKYQVNVSVRSRKKSALGQTYFPRVVLSLTVDGVAGYYRYEIPVEVTDAGGS